ncbi:MAG: peptide chain release factor N(5)-glutamine methyltransferase [Spirochaetales bacterium]|nr:peptide chain release factor N(5)-glutamine methyltransferase [Spirochaetales bacterium]
MTVREALRRARTTLTNSPTAYLDSLVLAAWAVGIPKEKLLAMLSDPFPHQEEQAFFDGIEKRAEGLPVAYITGTKEFWGMNFRVGPGVLIPRPDTEILVEEALDRAGSPGGFSKEVLDLCTGSGCIACALAKELPHARISASDLSPAALEYASRNLADLGLPVHLIESDLFSRIPGIFDMIVTNPPYVADNEYGFLSKEVQAEPVSALVSGNDGLDVIRRIIHESVERIRGNGYLCMEAAPGQADEIFSLMGAHGFGDIRFRRDLSGTVRVISGQKRHEDTVTTL